jgi:hypothetical protein
MFGSIVMPPTYRWIAIPYIFEVLTIQISIQDLIGRTWATMQQDLLQQNSQRESGIITCEAHGTILEN